MFRRVARLPGGLLARPGAAFAFALVLGLRRRHVDAVPAPRRGRRRAQRAARCSLHWLRDGTLALPLVLAAVVARSVRGAPPRSALARASAPPAGARWSVRPAPGSPPPCSAAIGLGPLHGALFGATTAATSCRSSCTSARQPARARRRACRSLRRRARARAPHPVGRARHAPLAPADRPRRAASPCDGAVCARGRRARARSSPARQRAAGHRARSPPARRAPTDAAGQALRRPGDRRRHPAQPLRRPRPPGQDVRPRRPDRRRPRAGGEPQGLSSACATTRSSRSSSAPTSATASRSTSPTTPRGGEYGMHIDGLAFDAASSGDAVGDNAVLGRRQRRHAHLPLLGPRRHASSRARTTSAPARATATPSRTGCSARSPSSRRARRTSHPDTGEPLALRLGGDRSCPPTARPSAST